MQNNNLYISANNKLNKNNYYKDTNKYHITPINKNANNLEN